MISRDPAGRLPTQIRPLSIEPGFNRYAEGSVLIRCGNTHVLCTASIEESVPPWLKGKGQGWVTAEYSMLPRSTHTRSRRDREKVSGRTQEIQRLIGRALRAMVNLKNLGERSILIDCDVLQADGGTRTASITGGCVALVLAIEHLKRQGKLAAQPWIDTVAAVSVGLKDGTPLVDLDYQEDSSCDVDMNFVVTSNDALVEVQGTGEQKSFTRTELNSLIEAGFQGIHQIRDLQNQVLQSLGITR